MKVSLWAEIRRLHEIEHLSQRAIAQRLRCCHTTVNKALAMEELPSQVVRQPRTSKLDPFKQRIDELIARYPRLSAVRVGEEISRGEAGYRGRITLVKDYLRTIRPARGRVYHEVLYEPGEAFQVDWGSCGRLQIGDTSRKVSVLVAVLCYSRLCYIEFSLSQRKAEFYRCLVNALTFFGGSPRKIIFDNLKTAVISGAGRYATFHPEFLEMCGYFYLEPIACAARDPESKGTVEVNVRYVKQNALAGRDHELTCWDDYRKLATYWRDEVANVRVHETTRQPPVDRFRDEQSTLRRLPRMPFPTDEITSAVVSSHARIRFDANRYSVPPELIRHTVTVRADDRQVRIVYQGQEMACHPRCFQRGQLIRQEAHLSQARTMRQRQRKHSLEAAFAALGPAAQVFHGRLLKRPVKPLLHLRRLLKLVDLYGRDEVLPAIEQALEYETYDASYVEALLHQRRRQRELPSPTKILPRCPEWIEATDYEPVDLASYDRFLNDPSETQDEDRSPGKDEP